MMIIMMARLLLLLSSTLSIQLSLEHIKYTFMHAHLCKLNRSLAVDVDTHIFIGGLSAKAHSLSLPLIFQTLLSLLFSVNEHTH